MKSGVQSCKWRHKLRDFLSLSVSSFVTAVVSTSRAAFVVLEEARTALATVEIRTPPMQVEGHLKPRMKTRK